jgi:hypothetical protein
VTHEGTPITEVKRHLDGRQERFACALLEATPHRVVVKFRIPGTRRAPLERWSYGVFWRRRPYNCYFVTPPGSVVPVWVRFDVVRDVEFALDGDAPEVRFTDLLLDLRVDFDEGRPTPRWEDADEAETARSAGLLSDTDLATIERARRTLEARHAHLVREVAALVARLEG